ncbi:hydantoinase/oxoprolinase N-terminal domain-containing protein [Arthrobacter sp. R4]|uniref:hydantoinase/oxoprolinase N-terminal domain-containing protein n=1 Tax=Arthrobacter sp. R4 TaxID=644417 RepID=UPI003EDAF477
MSAAHGSYKVGIDVGGTNTDAVVLDQNNNVLTAIKRATSEDVIEGIRAALSAALDSVDDPRLVGRVMLGTTAATNAIVERRNLGRTAVIRLGSPAGDVVPPMEGWPLELRDAVSAGVLMTSGGHFVNGAEIMPLDEEAVEDFLQEVQGQADAVAITGIFSPMNTEHEQRVAKIVERFLGPEVPVSLSSEVGQVGLLDRENATILNAALSDVIGIVTAALTSGIAERGIAPELYIAQNDGTLMTVDFAARFPVFTIGSGPANSIRGAAFLSGLADAIVADVGGTTTDFGCIAGGFPRESSSASVIGGVRTNFRMPDVLSIAIGGGSIIDGPVPVPTIGPQSVGHTIGQHALVFGGMTPTLTDAAVHVGRSTLGTHRIPNAQGARLAAALELSAAEIAEAVDAMQSGKGSSPLVAVGGGSFLIPDDLPGVSRVVRPPLAHVANAVGAAIALVSGRADSIVPATQRNASIEGVCESAKQRAIAAGADPASVEVIEVLEIPMSYLTEPTIHIHVKAAGPLTATAN